MASSLTVEALGGIPPILIQAYALNHGWERHPERRLPSASVWTSDSDDRDRQRQLLLPEDPTFDDYALRVGDALRVFADQTGLPIEHVLQDVVLTQSDVVRFKSEADAVEGSIALADGIELFTSIRDSLKAGAKAHKEKLSYFGSKYGQYANRFLTRVRLGQTEHSSYVVTVLSRVPAPQLGDSSQFSGQLVMGSQPTEDRLIVESILTALGALREAIDQYAGGADIEVFYDAVGAGASADLCDSVARLTAAASGGTVATSVSWSPLLPTDRDVPTGINFGPKDTRILQEAGLELRESEVEPDVVIDGWVERLIRYRTTAGSGDVVVVVPDLSGARVRIPLEAGDYEEAGRAHLEGESIAVLGGLVKRGNRFWLTGASLQRDQESKT